MAAYDDAPVLGTTEEIPTFRMSDFEKDPAAFAKALGEGFLRYGFVGLADHGIDDAAIQRSYKAAMAFFDRPEAEKLEQDASAIGGQRGYTGFGRENAKGNSRADLKEFYHVGRELAADHPRRAELSDIMMDNRFPADRPEFRTEMLGIYSQLETLAGRVMSALAIYLGESPDFFKDKMDAGNSILRPIHYPPVQDLTTKAVRAGAHEDINAITLLVGSQEPGLQVLNRQQQWVPVTSIEGTIVCNIGDMLQRLTNNLLPSTTHRVVNPEGPRRLKPRFSMPYFHHFNPDYVIRTLPQCVTATTPNAYPTPLFADDYLVERLGEIGLMSPAQVDARMAHNRQRWGTQWAAGGGAPAPAAPKRVAAPVMAPK